MYFATRTVSSLEKVFCCPELPGERLDRISGAQGERVAFQLACRADSNLILEIECSSPFGEGVSLREVGLVPCTQPAMPDDPYVLTHRPGLFPDALLPLENNRFRLSRNNWHALWCTVRIPSDMEPGEYEIAFRITTPQDLLIWKEPEMEHRTGIRLRVLPFRLPEQKLLSANWFYADCVSIRHRTACWTEPFWKLLEAYFRNMVEHGNNVLYTPLWSVPLDTAIGRERPTAQLLEIEWKEGKYFFDFHRLERWIDTAHACGFRYFEMSHAFTQWGAKATPKIVVRVNGVEEKRFGWHVPASDPEYRTFLRALMEKLLPFFRNKGLTPANTFFHVSDEPSAEGKESYCFASALLRGLIGEYPVIDALSDVEFLREKWISRPIPTTTALETFMKEPVEQRWVYYCGNWEDGVPNRQFGMPSARNRILGLLLYLYDLDGFLNWGYNFWFTQHSLNWELDPYQDPEAGRAFCGGGAFMVYPGKDGPVDSLHYEVFAEGLQDLRALRLLESRIGRDALLRLIREEAGEMPTIHRYPRESEWLLRFRERINTLLSEKSGNA